MTSALATTMLFCGAYAVITQSYLAREFLVVFQGNEMSLAVLLAGWLAGVAGGARAAKARIFSRARPAFLLMCFLPAWVVVFPASVLTVRLSRVILHVPAGMLAPFWKLLLASVLFAGPFAAFVGFTFVTVCRLWEGFSGGGKPVGRVYVAEAAGGVAGGALFTFWLAGRFGPFSFALGVYAVLGALVAALAWVSYKNSLISGRSAGSIITGMVLLAGVGVGLAAGGRGSALETNTHVARMASIAQGVVMESRESRYQNVTAMLLSGEYTVYGNGEALMTFPEPLLTEQEAFLILAERGAASDVLVVGGGPEFVSAVLSYGVERVDYVELDPTVVEVSRPFLEAEVRAALASPRLGIHYGDARRFVAEAAKEGARWDVIIVRAPDPSTLLVNRLFTREFMLSARRCLRKRGVFAIPVTLAGNYLKGEVGRYGGDVYRTMQSVFADIVAVPDVHSIFIASREKGVVTTSLDELSRRFKKRGVTSGLYPAAFGLAFPPERTAEMNEALRDLPGGSINTDWHPTTYAANLALWTRFSSSPIAHWLAAATSIPRGVLFGVIVIVALLGALPAFIRRKRPPAAAVAVLYTGWAALSMTVLLLYAFQVTCGYVYGWIGVLIGSFVAGTAGGGALGTAWGNSVRGLRAAEAAVAAAPLLMAAMLYGVGNFVAPETARWFVLAGAGLAGLVTGFEFPVAAGVLHAERFTAQAAGSRLETMDHSGAAIGAVLTGVVVVPALGIWLSLVLVAMVKVVSALCVVWCLPVLRRGNGGGAV